LDIIINIDRISSSCEQSNGDNWTGPLNVRVIADEFITTRERRDVFLENLHKMRLFVV
jgi:hypothetical protein